jgi:hypothetical protein
VGSAAAPKFVDAGVSGDLVDPGLEGDRPLGFPEAAERRDEHVLGDVLRPAVVRHHSEHIGADLQPVAAVQLLEGPIVTASDCDDQLVV